MSKVDELKAKYPSVTPTSFNRFYNADVTPTKKYLNYILRAWEDRKSSPYHRTSTTIIDLVLKFDELLPYITNKDIYSGEYRHLQDLNQVVQKAIETREEKTFVREEHANVLIENDRFILLQPITHRGSLKYGASTRWCTASKNDDSTFNRYMRNGLLVYLIDKCGDKTQNYKKVAFYHDYSYKGMNDSIGIYNTPDNMCTESQVIGGGWDEDDLFEIFMSIRYYFSKTKKTKKSRDFVDSFVNTLNNLDFKKFEEHLSKLEETTNLSYINNAEGAVKSFLESLKQSKYGIRKTEN